MSPSALRLQASLHGKTVLMGIGNRWRADDAAGPEVASRLAGRSLARCIDAGDAPERHLGEAVEARPDAVLLVDSVDFGGAPGEVAVFALEDLPARLGTTHDVSLAVLMRYLRAMTRADILLLGIQPATTHFGGRMSAAVSDAVSVVTEMLAAQLGSDLLPDICTSLSSGPPCPAHAADSTHGIPRDGAEEGGRRR